MKKYPLILSLLVAVSSMAMFAKDTKQVSKKVKCAKVSLYAFETLASGVLFWFATETGIRNAMGKKENKNLLGHGFNAAISAPFLMHGLRGLYQEVGKPVGKGAVRLSKMFQPATTNFVNWLKNLKAEKTA